MAHNSQVFSSDSSDLFENPAHAHANCDEKSFEHYSEIGKTLLHAERLYLYVGIPLSPPSFSKSSQTKKPELTDFLKESLVNINTKTLLSYCSDLERAATDNSSAGLNISITKAQRYFFPIIAISLTALLTIPSLILSGLTLSMSLVIGLFFTSFAGFASCETVRDSYRRNSFQSILEMEIERRQGRNSNRGGTQKLMPICG